QQRLIAVGTPLPNAPRTDPYVRNSRIRLPPWVFDGKPLMRPGVKDSRFRQPGVGQPRYPRPRRPIFLAAPPKAASPQIGHVKAEGARRSTIGGQGVIGKKAGNDLPQPLSLRRDRLMHSPPQLFLNCLEPRAYAVPPALPFELEIALAGLAADEREAQKVE